MRVLFTSVACGPYSPRPKDCPGLGDPNTLKTLKITNWPISLGGCHPPDPPPVTADELEKKIRALNFVLAILFPGSVDLVRHQIGADFGADPVAKLAPISAPKSAPILSPNSAPIWRRFRRRNLVSYQYFGRQGAGDRVLGCIRPAGSARLGAARLGSARPKRRPKSAFVWSILKILLKTFVQNKLSKICSPVAPVIIWSAKRRSKRRPKSACSKRSRSSITIQMCAVCDFVRRRTISHDLV